MAGKVKNLLNKKFGRLTVVSYQGVSKDHRGLWLCKCDCGNYKIVKSKTLLSGDCQSCGCLSLEQIKQMAIKHNKSNTRLYKIWQGIKRRCLNKNSKLYKHYGGRGITMCDEWKNDFMTFYNWSIENGYNDNLTIDRINNDGNYEPTNCRWATYKQQENNRRNNVVLEYNNEYHTISEWCDIKKITFATLQSRLKRNWAIERALNTPMQKKRKNEQQSI